METTNRERYILHADFDGFYIAVERALNPWLRGRPVAIGSRADRRGVIAAASAEARRHGIYPSMSAARALTVCPSLTILDSNGDLYRRAAEKVGELLQRFSPCVEASSCDEAFVDLTGTHRLFGAAIDAAAHLRRELTDRFGLDLTIGVAVNKLVSRIASRTVRPTGLCEVLPGSESAFLAPLVVSCLPGVGPQTEKRLRELNLTTIGDLAQSPRPLLTATFGRHGEALHARARGIDDTPVRPSPTPAVIHHEETLLHDTNDRDTLRGMLFTLVEHCGCELRLRGLLAGRMSVAVEFVDSRRISAAVLLSPPTDLDDDLCASAREALTSVLRTRLAVRHLAARCSRLSPGTGQLALFDDGRHADRRRALARAVDRIRETHGFTAVTYGRAFTPGLVAA